MSDAFRRLRSAIRKLPTRNAAAFVAAFHLPESEELAVLLIDVERLSAVQTAEAMNVSPETVKRRRAAAYARMVTEIRDIDNR